MTADTTENGMNAAGGQQLRSLGGGEVRAEPQGRLRSITFVSRWLWIVVVAVSLLAAGYLQLHAGPPSDGAATIAHAASIRQSLLRVAGAADDALARGDSTLLEAAISDLDRDYASLREAVATVLGPSNTGNLAELGVAIGSLSAAARAYASGGEAVGAGGESFAEASQLVDALVDELALSVDGSTENSNGTAERVALLILVAGAITAGTLWAASRRIVRLRGRADASDRNLAGITNHLPDMVYETDASGALTFVTEASMRLLGRPPAEMVGLPLSDFVAAPDSLARLTVESEAEAVETELDWLHADGSKRRYSVQVRTLLTGSDVETHGIVRDISARVAVEAALRESEERFAAMLETAQNGMMVAAPGGQILVTNRAVRDLLGYSATELETMNVAQLVPAAALERITSLMASQLWNGASASRQEEQVVRHDGEIRDVEMSVSSYGEHDEIVGVLVELHDITEAKQATERIQRMADYDSLTGLPNRFHFQRKVEEAIESASGQHSMLALLLIDLDRFKVVNDALGHAAGDELLCGVADRLREHLPRTHTLGRFGGDEFMVLVPAIETPDAAAETARLIETILRSPFVCEGRKVHSPASVGVSVFPDDGEDAETLLRHADAAMYRAKKQGGNGYQFANPSLDTTMNGRLTMEADLHRAIERQEFVVYYQPLVDASTGAIRSFEALVRWEHPEQGLIPPSSFIPLLEETGLIAPAGEWVMRRACEDARRWMVEGLPAVPVSVNLSPYQLLHSDVVETVRRVLHETELEPRYLQLEVTETAAMEDMEAVVQVLHELHAQGVESVIDDFGTGHSSLSRLKELPVSTLKIDRSFVAGVTENEDDRAIVVAVIALAHALGLEVVAEGVETEAQLETLRTFGCDLLQGYLFAQPLPAEAASALLQRGLRGRLESAA